MPQRIVDDAVDVARLPPRGIENHESALYDFSVAKRRGVCKKRNGEVAGPGQAVALHAVDEKLAHAKAQRAKRRLAHRHLALGARERHAVLHVSDFLDEADDLWLLALEAEVAQRDRKRRTPDAAFHFDDEIRLLEERGILVHRLGLRLAEVERRLRGTLRLDVASRFFSDVVKLAVAAKVDDTRRKLLHPLRGNVVWNLEEFPRVSHVQVERNNILSHVAQYRRKVLHVVRRLRHGCTHHQSEYCKGDAFHICSLSIH